MSSTDIVVEGNYIGGWLDTMVNFEFPSSVAVFTFDLSWTGDSQSGTNGPYSDTPTVTVSGAGGNAQMSILSGGVQMINKSPGIAAFAPFQKQDKSSVPIPKFWDYTSATFMWGLKGAAYPGGEVVGSGANGQECFDDAINKLVGSLGAYFGWDRTTVLKNLVGVTDYFSWFVFMGWITNTHTSNPGQNPAAPQPPAGNFDPNAVTVLRGGGNNNILQDWRNSALVIPISPFKGPGKTVSISMDLKGPPKGNTFTWAAGCATYKKPPKGWKTYPPAGWNIGAQTYPTYATYPWHRTQGYDKQLLGQPNGSVDDKELNSSHPPGGAGVDSGAQPGPRNLKFTINAKTLGIAAAG